MAPDPRLTPARSDLSAAHLKGQVEAEHFAEADRRGIAAASAPLRRRPSPDAPLDTEALFGESVDVYEQQEGWAWVQLRRDGYVGYLPVEALGEPVESTHRVAAPRTHAYPGPSIKLPPLRAISLGSLIAIDRFEGEFAIAREGAYYWGRHLAPFDSVEADFVEVASRFLHAPYLWGGRTSEGVDCSGLVQTALRASGVPAPRDSDMMERELGEKLAPGVALRRGDLVFWRGHVGVMTDSENLLHANGFHMAVAEEPMELVRRRFLDSGAGRITSIRRL